ncbi:MAG: exopolysaccharide Pel transporter PelG [Deltaproteobacteria bacterium]|nr:exopolysaccharide Pel transporter PelG [Deltaproteobacteria bacterium]
MAGIGFRLQRLLSGESYTDWLRAYLYSAVITTGPMLIVITTLALIKWQFSHYVSLEEGQLLLGLIVYAYTASMLGVAPFQYIVTRYLADQHYARQLDRFTPAYGGALCCVFPLQALVGLAYLTSQPFSVVTKWALLMLLLSVSGTWIAMLFLSAARSFQWIGAAFLCGGVVGYGAAVWFGTQRGFDGFLLGFALGQGVTWLILSVRIAREFGLPRGPEFFFLRYFKTHPLLALIGVAYTVGIWVDKWCFWFSDAGNAIGGNLRVCFAYDTPMFLAFLTIVPSMAFFLVQIETNFVRVYWSYYHAIRQRAPLTTIRAHETNVRETITTQLRRFALFQGLVTGVIILFFLEISEFFQLNPAQFGIFRIGLLGAFLQMGILIILTFFFYFDWQREALVLTGLFAVLNGGFALGTLAVGLPAYGFGFAAASFITLLWGTIRLYERVEALTFITFMHQPITPPPQEFEAEARRRPVTLDEPSFGVS